jgi:hypothetical protein
VFGRVFRFLFRCGLIPYRYSADGIFVQRHGKWNRDGLPRRDPRGKQVQAPPRLRLEFQQFLERRGVLFRLAHRDTYYESAIRFWYNRILFGLEHRHRYDETLIRFWHKRDYEIYCAAVEVPVVIGPTKFADELARLDISYMITDHFRQYRQHWTPYRLFSPADLTLLMLKYDSVENRFGGGYLVFSLDT